MEIHIKQFQFRKYRRLIWNLKISPEAIRNVIEDISAGSIDYIGCVGFIVDWRKFGHVLGLLMCRLNTLIRLGSTESAPPAS